MRPWALAALVTIAAAAAVPQAPDAAPAPAPPPHHQDNAPHAVITGPEQVAPGDMAVLSGADSVGTGHTWRLVNSAKSFLPVDNGVRVVFASGTVGNYTFVLAVAAGGRADLAVFTVTVGTPVPPQPPQPPQPPAPSDPLWPAIKAAFDADTSTPDKAGCARRLAAAFAAANPNDPGLATLADLQSASGKAAAAACPLPALQSVRQLLANEFAAQLGTNPTTPLTPDLRAKAGTLCRRVSTLYGQLAGG